MSIVWVSAEKIRSFILNPQGVDIPYQDMVMSLKKGGTMYPEHLPDLNTMKVLFPVLVAFVKWWMTSKEWDVDHPT